MLDESVMLLGCTLSQWVEPVGIVGNPHFECPFLHTGCHFISNTAIQRSTIVDHVNQFGIYLARQIPEHLFLVEHILGIIFRRTFRGGCHCNGFLFKRRFYYSESQFRHNTLLLLVRKLVIRVW